jgi:hypothetical protein
MELQYACRYWIHHLEQSDFLDIRGVLDFLEAHFIHWLEALSIMKLLSQVLDMVGILNSRVEVSVELRHLKPL